MGTTHVWKFDPCCTPDQYLFWHNTQQQQAPHNNTSEVMTTTQLNSRWMILATCATLAPTGPTLWLHGYTIYAYSSSAVLPVWSDTTDLAMYSHPCQEYPQPHKRAKNSRLDMNTRYRACSYTHWPAKHHHPTVLTKNQKHRTNLAYNKHSRQYATTILETRRQMLLHCHTNFCSQHVAL